MNRRQLLATLGTAIGGLAGCLTGTPGESTVTPVGDDTDEEPVASPTPGDTPIAISDIVVQKAVTYESLMGSGGVLAADGRQYAIVAVERTDPSRDVEFVFETDTDSWEAGLPVTAGSNAHSVAGLPRPLVGFDLPSPLSASNPRVRERTTGTERALSADGESLLAAAGPSYEFDELTAPESVSQGETMTVELTASNVSETDGRFLAAVYWPTERIADDDESHIVDRTVPAGDTVSATLDIDTAYTAVESGPVTLSVEGHVSASREIQVEDVDTAG